MQNMRHTLFRALLLTIAFGQCHAAVTWTTVGCDGWTFKGVPIDDIWDNAMLMTTNAQSRINAIPTNFVGVRKTNAVEAGANAVFMFNIPWSKNTGTTRAGTATMAQVSGE
jgi:hypothetical protein